MNDASDAQATLERSHAELLKDLADSRKMHAELQANETHFRALVETSGDIVWAVDGSGCYTYVNGAALEAILGYRAEEIIGYPFAQFADRASAQAFDDEFFRLTESGGQLEVKGIFRHRTGRSVDLAIRAIGLYDEQGQFIGASGTAVDVSEIKAAESMLRQALAEQHAILNSATVGIAIVENGTIIRANSEFETMFRYPTGRAEGLSVCELQSVDGSRGVACGRGHRCRQARRIRPGHYGSACRRQHAVVPAHRAHVRPDRQRETRRSGSSRIFPIASRRSRRSNMPRCTIR